MYNSGVWPEDIPYSQYSIAEKLGHDKTLPNQYPENSENPMIYVL